MQAFVTVVLVLIAIAGAVVGMMSLSRATEGVGLLALACLFAILARISQASEHHAELKRMMNAGR